MPISVQSSPNDRLDRRLSSVVLPLTDLGLSRGPRTRGRIVRPLLLYALVLDVGIIGLPLGFIPHVFFPDQATELIG